MQKYIFILFLIVVSVITAQTPKDAINRFAQDPTLKNALVSFKAVEISDGNVIASFDPKRAIVSASTTKLFSTASAFEILGPQYRAITRIYIDGPIDSLGILHGNIWIRGGGDVSLGSKFFSNENEELLFLNAWTDSILSKGIHGVTGAVISDGSSFGYEGAPAGWATNDLGNYFGAVSGGINFYDNTVKLNFSSGKMGSKTILKSIYPKIDGLTFSNSVLAANVSGDDCYVYGAPYTYQRLATGKIPANQSNFIVKGSMPDPELHLAKYWFDILKSKGIEVKNGATSQRIFLGKNNYANNFTLLFTQEGKSVKEIAYWTNLKSVNLFAEGLFNLIGYETKNIGSNTESIKVFHQYWDAKINLEGMTIHDGSGLSRLNAISADHFCELLIYMSKSKEFENFKSTLPIAGKTGTIKSLCRGGIGEGRIFAKSGTINKVKAYAGYVKTVSGKDLVFSFTVNNYSCSTSDLVSKMEQVLNAIAAY